MKHRFYLLAGAIILAGACLTPIKSNAQLLPVTNVKIAGGATLATAYYDDQNKQYWYLDATKTPTQSLVSDGNSTTLGTYSDQANVAIPAIFDHTQYSLGIENWHMAKYSEFLALLDSINHSDPAAAAITVNGYSVNTGTVDPNLVGDTTRYNLVRWDDIGSTNGTGFHNISVMDNTGESTVGDVDDTWTNLGGINLPDNFLIGAYAVTNAVPEPSTYALLFIALSVVAGVRVVQQRAKKATVINQVLN